MAILLMVGMAGIQPAKPVQAANPLRISQVYGGGGSVGSTYTHDFVEIYNSGTSPASLSGMSIQYASATGTGNFGATATQRTELPDVLLGPGQYYLIQESGGTNGSPLPTPDLIDGTAINVSGTAGKLALVNSQVSLGCNGGSAPCTPEQLALIIDLVGFGNANFYEGTAAAPAPSTTTSVIRKGSGCTDTDNNSLDFEALTPTPRNTASPTHACGPVEIFPTELFFSEYIEGSGNNKALEIFNGTGTAVDLANYQILYYNNGSPTPTITYPLTGTVAAGDVFVLTTDAADPVLLAAADVVLTYPSVVHFNGDDALALQKISPLTTLDVIGQIGLDPGYFWGTEPITTAEHTLTRKDTICEGDPDGSDPFDPALEWNGFAQNDFSHIGFHDTNCFPPTEEAPTVLSTIPTNGGTAQKTDNIVITFSEPVTVVEPWFSISCADSGTHTATVTDEDPIFTLNPDTDFASGETCAVTIDHTKVYDDDLDDASADYMLADYTFSFSVAAGCGDSYTPIYDIQGTGETSPLAGTNLTTEGVVVGDFQVGGRAGYYIQDPTGDNNPATSDGIFIYNTATDVNVGDHVRVSGKAVEYYGITEISPVNQVIICSTGNTVTPTQVTLPVTAVTDFEKYESMLVTFPQSLIISEYFNFDRYGEIVLTSQRHMTPTAFVEPGADAQAAAQAYLLDRITLDDGRTAQNPDPAIHPNGQVFTMDNLFRGGGTVTGVTGVMDYYQNLYRIQPTVGATYADANPRTAAPEIVEGDLKLASFNVLNYFVTLDDGTNDICGPSGTLECRGADDATEFDRQKAKILSALDVIDADIFGLMEIENDSPVSGNDAVADLVAGLNEIKGEGTYAYINTGAIGTDAIKQAILYKPASVTPIGTFELLTTAIDDRFIDTANRPALAQVFMDNETGIEFVVAVNHLKSKGSACAGDPDLGDGQGNCNLTRKAAAEALVDWLANSVYFSDVEKAIIIGDLNSYDKEDPIDMIKLGSDGIADTADDYLDMIFEKRGELAYGYVYDGQTGYLDHALANEAMAESIVDVNFWHINADEPDIIDYDTSFKLPAQDDLYAPDAYRSSDHDPVIVTLSFVPLSVTDVALVQSTDLDTWSPVEGNLSEGYALNLDTTVEYYFLDAESVTSNRALADGSYPFFMTGNPGAAFFAYWAERGVEEGATGWQGLMWQIINGDAPMFFLKVEGTTFTLIDGLQGDPNLLRVNGDYYPGLYTFSGAVKDGFGFEDQLDVTVFINHFPVAHDLAVTTPEDTWIDIALTAEDFDGDVLEYVIVDQPAHGTVTLVGNVATYTPALNYYGTDSFTYKANDGAVDSNMAVVTITVTPVNDAPVAVEDAYTTDEDEVLTVALADGVLANDTDVDGDALTAILVNDVSNGILVLAGDGSFVYTPETDFFGTDSFTYKASDGTLESEPVTVTITVEPVNDWPVANDDAYETMAGVTLEVAAPGVLENDVLLDPNETVTLEVLVQPAGGTVTLNADGSFTYVPNAGFFGVDTFEYQLNSTVMLNGEFSDTAVVTITVTAKQLFLPLILR